MIRIAGVPVVRELALAWKGKLLAVSQHVRIARPVTDITRSVAMYTRGLDLHEIGRFVDHDGFDGVMLQEPGKGRGTAAHSRIRTATGWSSSNHHGVNSREQMPASATQRPIDLIVRRHHR